MATDYRTQSEPQVRSSELVLPQRGDRFMHHTGYTLTVVKVDGSMTNVQTSAGNIIRIPTGTLMAYPNMRQNGRDQR